MQTVNEFSYLKSLLSLLLVGKYYPDSQTSPFKASPSPYCPEIIIETYSKGTNQTL